MRRGGRGGSNDLLDDRGRWWVGEWEGASSYLGEVLAKAGILLGDLEGELTGVANDDHGGTFLVLFLGGWVGGLGTGGGGGGGLNELLYARERWVGGWVGEGRRTLGSRRWRVERTNTAVLPIPDLAWQMMSMPRMACGMHSCWTRGKRGVCVWVGEMLSFSSSSSFWWRITILRVCVCGVGGSGWVGG